MISYSLLCARGFSSSRAHEGKTFDVAATRTLVPVAQSGHSGTFPSLLHEEVDAVYRNSKYFIMFMLWGEVDLVYSQLLL